MLPTAALDYTLPEDRIATAPVSPRDSARMLVLRRADPEFIEHRQVRDLPEYLSPGDVLVVNTSRVIPARIQGVRADTMGKVEGLYLGPDESDPSRWRVMLKGRRMRENARIALHDADGQPTQLSLILHRRSESEGEAGAWICSPDGPADLLALGAIALLDRVGSTPLPPYILAARKRLADAPTPSERDDRATYQTVYARADQPSTGPAGPAGPAGPGSGINASHGAAGSIAAPTAGLHFTPELLGRLAARGVLRVDVTLHVGTGTFKPVECEFVEQHPMHSEWCTIPPDTARVIARARAQGRRVVAVGTTSARTLESFPTLQPALDGTPLEHWTKLLITPGHRWKHLDSMLTNFHLPRSTLMAMIASLLDSTPGTADIPSRGVARLQAAYAAALSSNYRFYSFGDAMLVL